MDERSPKRRRASNSPSDREQRQHATPRRASYMSPTKASLARFNPKLLESPHLSKSPRRPSSRGPATAKIDEEAANRTESPQNHAIEPTSDKHSNDDRAAQNPFGDLDLDPGNTHDAATPQAEHSEPSENSDRPETNRQQEDREHERARAAKAREKQETVKELQSLRRSCKQLEQLLDQAKSTNGQDSLDNASISRLAALLSYEDDEESEKADAQPMSTLLNSFLPFTSHHLSDTAPTYEDFDVPSHRPLELKDPLPCLQLFSELRFSLDTDPPRTDRDAKGQVSSLQRQYLRFSDASKVFAGKVEFDVSATGDESTAPGIKSISTLEVSRWARAELLPGLQQQQKHGDLGCLTYGLGSYYEMSMKRARAWTKCEQRYPHLLKTFSQDDKENLDMPPAAEFNSKAGLILQMGRRSLVMQNNEVLLRVTWAIKLDWTGEAESEVTAHAAFAQPYHNLDNRKSLSKVPITFDRLVKDRGVFAAVESMVSVLFS